VRDMDQTLVTAPVVCLLGGWALAKVNVPERRFTVPAATVAMMALSLYCFRRPPVTDLKLSSNGTIRFANDWMRSTFAAVDVLRAEGPVAIVCYDSVVTWRQISYYYPDTPLLYLPGAENGSQPVSPFWVLHSHMTAAGNPISLPESVNIAWSVPAGPGIRETLAHYGPVRELNPLVVVRTSKGSRFHFGMWDFATASNWNIGTGNRD
jgi:hypothetical protein